MIKGNIALLNNELSLELAIQEKYLLDEICQDEGYTNTFYSFRKLNKKLRKQLRICNKIEKEVSKNFLKNRDKLSSLLKSLFFNESEYKILFSLDLLREERIKEGFVKSIEIEKGIEAISLDELSRTCSEIKKFNSYLQQAATALEANNIEHFKLVVA